MPVDIYDLLASQDVSVTTLTQLDSAIKNTSIDRTNSKFWNGPITVYRTIESSRTYPGGCMPIPEASEVVNLVVEHGAYEQLVPLNTSIYNIVSIASDAAVSVLLFGSGGATLLGTVTGGSTFIYPAPLFITPTLYLRIANSSGAPAAVSIAYHTVGL